MTFAKFFKPCKMPCSFWIQGKKSYIYSLFSSNCHYFLVVPYFCHCNRQRIRHLFLTFSSSNIDRTFLQQNKRQAKNRVQLSLSLRFPYFCHCNRQKTGHLSLPFSSSNIEPFYDKIKGRANRVSDKKHNKPPLLGSSNGLSQVLSGVYRHSRKYCDNSVSLQILPSWFS